MTEDEYGDYLDKVIAKIATGELRTADQVAEKMIPDHVRNLKVFQALRNQKGGVTVLQLEKALARKAKHDSYEEKIHAHLGMDPQTEREMVACFITHGGYTCNFACEFIDPAGKPQKREQLLRDIQLTAADLRLTKKPLELKDKNFERALQEFTDEVRHTRLNEVLAVIDEPLEPAEREAIQRDMLALFDHMFKEAAFALASVRTVLWMIKRKMRGMKIPEPLFTVLYGKQRGGKSSFWGLVFRVISDMCKTVGVDALVAESMLDLYSFYLIDTDEMARADKACIAKLKNLVTTGKISRRLYYTQMMVDVPMQATLVGSSNVPIKSLITDPTGMRRFNQLDVKPRAQIEPHWHKIVHADWVKLWRSVDATAESPMEPFWDTLTRKQERMRTVDRVETWLDHWDFDPKTCPHYIKNSLTDSSVQFHALKLYEQFALFETKAFPGQKMTLGNWGTRMQAMIDEGGIESAAPWEYHTHGRRTLYTYTRSNVIALAYSQTAD